MIDKGHVVILGWSPRIYTVISELAIANANQPDGCVVILAERDRSDMEDELTGRLGDLRPTRVVCRTGDPSAIEDLELVAVGASKSVIAGIAPEATGEAKDASKFGALKHTTCELTITRPDVAEQSPGTAPTRGRLRAVGDRVRVRRTGRGRPAPGRGRDWLSVRLDGRVAPREPGEGNAPDAQ